MIHSLYQNARRLTRQIVLAALTREQSHKLAEVKVAWLHLWPDCVRCPQDYQSLLRNVKCCDTFWATAPATLSKGNVRLKMNEPTSCAEHIELTSSMSLKFCSQQWKPFTAHYETLNFSDAEVRIDCARWNCNQSNS